MTAQATTAHAMTARAMTARAAETDDATLARAHPLTLFGIDALVAGAARPRPGALALHDRHVSERDELSYADLYQRVSAFLARLRGFEFARGENALICCPPGAQALVALTATVAAGLDPVLAPLPLPMARGAIADAARALGVSALFAPARFCGFDFVDTLHGLAAQTPSIRLIGSLGGAFGGALDGAADFSRDALQAPMAPRARLNDGWSSDERALIGVIGDAGAIDFLTQGALLGAALDLVRATREAGEAPILSLVSPGSFGGLVAGPLAALLAGAPLHYLAPFDVAAFIDALDALGPARLVAPAAILPDLARAGLLTNGALIAVTALEKGGLAARIDVDPVDACPIIDVIVDGATLRIASRTPIDDKIQVRVM